MARKLDKSRPYGEIYGDAGGARFFQDDAHFDAAGNEIVTGEPAPKKATASAKKPAAKDVPPADAVDSQLAAQIGEDFGE